eukprot:172645-Chlamydomonas_euryale.AAC.1
MCLAFKHVEGRSAHAAEVPPMKHHCSIACVAALLAAASIWQDSNDYRRLGLTLPFLSALPPLAFLSILSLVGSASATGALPLPPTLDTFSSPASSKAGDEKVSRTGST